MNDFVFNYIFEETKDKGFINARHFRSYIQKKYGIKEQNIGTKLYTAINKYQINKYGRLINPQHTFYTKESERIKTQRENARKQARKNRKGFWLNDGGIK